MAAETYDGVMTTTFGGILKRLVLLAGGASLTILLVACSAGTEATSSTSGGGIPQGPIIIGMPIGLTGFISSYDGNVLKGAQVAADQINAAGGVNGHAIEIITSDTTSDMAKGGPAAEDVIAKGAQFILPSVDYNFGGDAARVAQEHNLIAISAADDVRMGHSIGNNIFNLDTGGTTAGAALAQYAVENRKWKNACVLDDTSLDADIINCKAFEESFTSQGGTIVASSTDRPTGGIDPDAALIRLASAKDSFDGIMFCGYPPAGVTILKQIREAGVNQDILLTDAFDGNFWQEPLKESDALKNIYIISYAPITPGESGDGDAAASLKLAADRGLGVTVSLSYLDGYSAVQAIAEAVASTKSVKADDIRPYLEAFVDHRLAIGPTTWTPTCHVRVGSPMFIASTAGGMEKFETIITATHLPADPCGKP